MRGLSLLVITLCLSCASGCPAAAEAAFAPVKVASNGVDLTAASQSEVDEKREREREMRKLTEELRQFERRYERQLEKCRDGNDRACFQAKETYSEIQILLRNNPGLATSPER